MRTAEGQLRVSAHSDRARRGDASLQPRGGTAAWLLPPSCRPTPGEAPGAGPSGPPARRSSSGPRER
eukprot:873111-Pyramimonas_sp.AAC.1